MDDRRGTATASDGSMIFWTVSNRSLYVSSLWGTAFPVADGVTDRDVADALSVLYQPDLHSVWQVTTLDRPTVTALRTLAYLQSQRLPIDFNQHFRLIARDGQHGLKELRHVFDRDAKWVSDLTATAEPRVKQIYESAYSLPPDSPVPGSYVAFRPNSETAIPTHLKSDQLVPLSLGQRQRLLSVLPRYEVGVEELSLVLNFFTTHPATVEAPKPEETFVSYLSRVGTEDEASLADKSSFMRLKINNVPGTYDEFLFAFVTAACLRYGPAALDTALANAHEANMFYSAALIPFVLFSLNNPNLPGPLARTFF